MFHSFFTSVFALQSDLDYNTSLVPSRLIHINLCVVSLAKLSVVVGRKACLSNILIDSYQFNIIN